MRNSIVGFSIVALAAVAQPAMAQDASFYNCRNKRVKLDIPAMPLGKALKVFTDKTRCPVSLDARQVANAPATAVPTAKVRGRYTPKQALDRMLSASPLKNRTIKGGFSIYYN